MSTHRKNYSRSVQRDRMRKRSRSLYSGQVNSRHDEGRKRLLAGYTRAGQFKRRQAIEVTSQSCVALFLLLTKADERGGCPGGLPPEKVHCSVLAEQAVKTALDDWFSTK